MLETAQKGAVGLSAPNVRHGANGLWVVVCPPLCRYICDHLACRLVVLRGVGWVAGAGGVCACGLVAVGAVRFLFDEMQDDVFGEAPQGCPAV